MEVCWSTRAKLADEVKETKKKTKANCQVQNTEPSCFQATAERSIERFWALLILAPLALGQCEKLSSID